MPTISSQCVCAMDKIEIKHGPYSHGIYTWED